MKKKTLDLANLELNKKKISSLNEESMRFIKGGEDLSNGDGIEGNGLVDVGIGDDGEAINPKTRFMCLTLLEKCSNRCSMASCGNTDGGVVIACIPL